MELPTHSTNHKVRTLLFMISSIFYNAWISVRKKQKKKDLFYHKSGYISQHDFKSILEKYVNQYIEQWPPPKMQRLAE